MPETKNEKEVAIEARDALEACEKARTHLKYAMDGLKKLEAQHLKAKALEEWAPQRMKNLMEARDGAFRMFEGYVKLHAASEEELRAQRYSSNVSRALSGAYGLVAAGKLAEILISGAKIAGAAKYVAQLDKAEKLTSIKDKLDITKDLVEAGRAAGLVTHPGAPPRPADARGAVEKTLVAGAKLSEATSDFADAVETGFAFLGLVDPPRGKATPSGSEMIVAMSKAMKALLAVLKEVQRRMEGMSVTQFAKSQHAAGWEKFSEGFGIVGNLVEALVALSNAFDAYQAANKLDDLALAQMSRSFRIAGIRSPKQALALQVMIGGDKHMVDAMAIKKTIHTIESGKQATRALNDEIMALRKRQKSAQATLFHFQTQYTVHLHRLVAAHSGARVALFNLKDSLKKAEAEQRAGGAGWRGAIGFLPERMEKEMQQMISTLARAEVRLN